MSREILFGLLAALLLASCRLAEAQEPAPQASGTGYEILMAGVDDVAAAFVNGEKVRETGWGMFEGVKGLHRPGYSGWIGIDRHLRPGANTIRFTLTNGDYPGGWGARFRVRHNGRIFFDYADGQQDSSPGVKISVGFTLDPAAGPPANLPPVVREPDIILRAEGNADFDHAAVYTQMQAQFDFLAAWLGRKPTEPIVIHLAPEDWGFSRDYGMWMDSRRIMDTSHNYAHEMMHCFCRDYLHFPNWMFEQLADIAYCESEVHLWKRHQEYSFKTQWVNERSGQLVYLRNVYGKDFYPRFFDLIHQDIVSGAYSVRTDSIVNLNHDMIAYMDRAAGESVLHHLAKKGFKPDQQ